MNMYILGINGGVRSNNQDASACLLKDSKLIAAAEEERFLKIKFATGVLPTNAIRFCLQFANISMQDVSYVVFPGITYNDITRILETYLKFHFGFCPKVKIVDHHMAHAASVFYTSAFDKSMIITADLTGDGKSTTLCSIWSALFFFSIWSASRMYGSLSQSLMHATQTPYACIFHNNSPSSTFV